MGEITRCGLCHGHILDVILDMGSQPLAENPHCKDTFPLVLLRCRECTLVQLSYQVDPKILFPYDHPYATGHSNDLIRHYRRLATQAMRSLQPGSLVVDIGCNDGTLLDNFAETMRTVGVEPTFQGEKAAAKDHHVYRDGFTRGWASQIREQHGRAKVIFACNVLAHVPDPHDFCRGVYDLLADDGVFVTENGDVETIISGNQFDTVYHEHLRYYSLPTISRLLAQNGLTVEGTERIRTHGGSHRVYAWRDAGLRGPRGLQERATEAASRLRKTLCDLPQPIWGIGATTRATPLVHFSGIAPFITKIAEVPGSDKIGSDLPGTSIPVVDEAELIAEQPPAAVLFSWHMQHSIVPKLRAKGYQGTIVIPLPEPELLDG